LFAKYLTEKSEASEEITLNKSVLTLLDADLSHIEFSGEKGGTITMVQRNICSGGIVEIKEKSGDSFFKNELKNAFGPLGIKTNDFASLFTFQDTLKFEFPSRGKEDFVIIRSVQKEKRDMVGIIACCLYDEIIKIQEVNNGRQEQKIRRSK
jgi:hypothetical protein